MFVNVRLSVGAPDDRYATADELSVAIEEMCAGFSNFDVEAEASEDGTEVWAVNEATVISIED